MTGPAPTPEPPYWAVIFTARRTDQPDDSYEQTAERMFELAAKQPGCLGYDTAGSDELSITVSYWESEAAIAAWKANIEHLDAQRQGRERWYEYFELRVARVERAHAFARPAS
jgi:heme-degrading monooxygenase HmoA